ncbi:hypothetical protein HPP92_022349 [Vanilla planifolia]|uniref:Uncharacterized protein n=1 Tax=Vanilla planifolia TaxID=51239 RepID=A0A835UD48_VANPL|nr:hypothetical protein HPP92_022349 [Vanilla planifolia]
MDPKGNITIKWDFQQFRVDGYTVSDARILGGNSRDVERLTILSSYTEVQNV